MATMLEDCIIAGVVWQRIGNEKLWKTAWVYLGATYRGSTEQYTEASKWCFWSSSSVLCTTQPILHAQCTQATLSATAMWLLHCCNNKGKKSLGAVGACAIERFTQICKKAAIQQAPLGKAWMLLLYLGSVFLAYGPIPLSAPGGLVSERKQPERQSFAERHLEGYDLLGPCPWVSGM